MFEGWFYVSFDEALACVILRYDDRLHIFSIDSDDAASIQFAPSDFLSLGRASIVSATAIAPPANCDSGMWRLFALSVLSAP
jgi:hypothetical protein